MFAILFGSLFLPSLGVRVVLAQKVGLLICFGQLYSRLLYVSSLQMLFGEGSAGIAGSLPVVEDLVPEAGIVWDQF